MVSETAVRGLPQITSGADYTRTTAIHSIEPLTLEPQRVSETTNAMLADSYRTRGAIFAFLMGPPKNLTRQDGMRIHSAVCEALGVDDISFRFQPGRRQAGGDTSFSMIMERSADQEHLVVEISASAPNVPVKLLLRYDWPRSIQLVFEDFDHAFGAVSETLGAGWQRVLAEARIRGQVNVNGASALSFLCNHVFHLTGSPHQGNNGGLTFLGFKYETIATQFTEEDQLSNPKRDVSVEVLRDDPQCLYLEVMSQWPQLATSSDGALELAPDKVRQFDSAPSEYLQNTISYMERAVIPLLAGPHSSRGE